MDFQFSVLSIEDDLDQFELIQTTLKGLPLKLRHAMTGEEAVEFIHEAVPDLLITDITLPDMRGWDVLDRMAEEGGVLDGVPVLVLTSHREAPHRIIGRLRDVADYMNKPFEPRALRGRVQELLGIT